VTFDRVSLAISRATGRPWAFVLAALLIVGWMATGPWFGWSDSHSLFINTATTIVTFLMCFAIQATQNRSEAAIQVKLDEIVRAIEAADNRLIGIEQRPADEIELIRINQTECSGDMG
jgi:low affinity Fe/Cu permease